MTVEIVTLGRFEVRVRGPEGERVEYAPASSELLKFLLCRSDCAASNAEVKPALWPGDDLLDDLEAARLRDGNFASARARLDEWFRNVGAGGIVLVDGDGIALDRSLCGVDALDADAAFAAIVRGELTGADALAALERYDRPFLPGDVPGKRGSSRVIPYVFTRREDLAQRTLFATAAALRAAARAAAPRDATFEALLARARDAHALALERQSQQVARALASAIAAAEGTAERAPSRPAARALPAAGTLVGRKRELDRLRAILGEPKCGLVLEVEGPAGAGTTALVRAAATELAASGERVVFDLTAAPLDGAPGDAPSAAVLAAAESIGPAAAGPALQPVAADLLRVLPQLAPWFGDPRRRPPEPLDARRRAALLAHAVRLLDRVRPALVFVDRLDLADESSRAFAAELLHQIGRYRETIRLALVLTARPADRLRRTLGLDNVERVWVDPLDERASRELAGRLAPGDDPAAIAALADGLPGNIAYLAEHRGVVDPGFAALRLAGASAEARELLGALARARRAIDFGSAVAAAGGTPGDDRWFDALEELQAEGWIDTRESGYAIRETLVARSLEAGSA